MKKIEKLEPILLKSEARRPYKIVQVVEKINELIDESNKHQDHLSASLREKSKAGGKK